MISFCDVVLSVKSLSPIERGRILFARGEAWQSAAYAEEDSRVDQQARESAIASFLESQKCHTQAENELGARQCFWRAADLLVEADEFEAALLPLKNAIRGHSDTAMRGLYYGCATRLFRIAQENGTKDAVDRLIREVRGDLLRAWAWRPWVGSEPDLESRDEREGALRIRDIPWSQLGVGSMLLPESARSLYFWPKDRFGICSMLLLYVSKRM